VHGHVVAEWTRGLSISAELHFPRTPMRICVRNITIYATSSLYASAPRWTTFHLSPCACAANPSKSSLHQPRVGRHPVARASPIECVPNAKRYRTGSPWLALRRLAVVGATLWLPLHASPAPCWLIKGYHGCIGTVQYHDTRKDEDCAPRATPQPTPIMTADMWRATKNTRRGCPSLVQPLVVPISACSVSHRCHHRTNICAHPVPSYAACETVEISSRPFEASHCQALLRGRPYRLGACFLFSRQSQSRWLMSS
jgi:hypothetical protein